MERAGLSSPPATPLAASSRPRFSPPPVESVLLTVFQLKEDARVFWFRIEALAVWHPNKLMETITVIGGCKTQGTTESPAQNTHLIISAAPCRGIPLQLILQKALIEIKVCMLMAVSMHIMDAILNSLTRADLTRAVDRMAYQIVASHIPVQE